MESSLYEWLIIHSDETIEKVEAMSMIEALDESKDEGYLAIACIRVALIGPCLR